MSVSANNGRVVSKARNFRAPVCRDHGPRSPGRANNRRSDDRPATRPRRIRQPSHRRKPSGRERCRRRGSCRTNERRSHSGTGGCCLRADWHPVLAAGGRRCLCPIVRPSAGGRRWSSALRCQSWLSLLGEGRSKLRQDDRSRGRAASGAHCHRQLSERSRVCGRRQPLAGIPSSNAADASGRRVANAGRLFSGGEGTCADAVQVGLWAWRML